MGLGLSMGIEPLSTHGSDTISGTDTLRPGRGIRAIQALTDMTFSAAEAEPGEFWFDLVATTVPEGQMVYGNWNAITPATGEGVAYFRTSVDHKPMPAPPDPPGFSAVFWETWDTENGADNAWAIEGTADPDFAEIVADGTQACNVPGDAGNRADFIHAETAFVGRLEAMVYLPASWDGSAPDQLIELFHPAHRVSVGIDTGNAIRVDAINLLGHSPFTTATIPLEEWVWVKLEVDGAGLASVEFIESADPIPPAWTGEGTRYADVSVGAPQDLASVRLGVTGGLVDTHFDNCRLLRLSGDAPPPPPPAEANTYTNATADTYTNATADTYQHTP